MCRVNWLSSDVLAVQLQPRQQTLLQLFAISATTGARVLLLEEHDAAWINLNDLFSVVKHTYVSLWRSQLAAMSSCGDVYEGCYLLERVNRNSPAISPSRQ